MLGMHGARYTRLRAGGGDCADVRGRPFDDRAIGRAAQFCPNAKIVHIDIDRSELHKIKKRGMSPSRRRGGALEALLPRVRPPCANRMAVACRTA